MENLYWIIHKIDVHTGFFSLLVSIITAYFTYRYVKLTNRLLNETLKNSSPNVVVYFEVLNKTLMLAIKNIGTENAHDIEIDLNPSIKGLEVTKEIKSLAPGATYKFYCGTFNEELSKEITRILKCTYKNSKNIQSYFTREVKLSMFNQTVHSDVVAQELNRIATILEKLHHDKGAN